MELRSNRTKNEYEELQIILNGMGFYEEGMELNEMRQIMDVLQMSSEAETNFYNYMDIRESELDFMYNEESIVLSSTMMSCSPEKSNHPEHTRKEDKLRSPIFSGRSKSDRVLESEEPMSTYFNCSSPDIPSETITVQAVVHHSIDWIPPTQHLQRKRLASACIVPSAKRSHNICDSTETITHVETLDNFTDDSSNISTKCVDGEMRSAVPQIKLYDSGFIPYSSLSNRSTDDTPSTADNLNNSNCSVPELRENTHEIHGPVSVRRIHDSGLNITTNISSENSMDILTGGASAPDNFGNGDSETAV